MNPPKGIDPKVWEMALGVAEPINPGTILHGIIAEAAAKAISQAIEAEREECAKIADPIHYEGRMSDYEKQAFDIRDVISQAIRNRSSTTTERNEG